MRIDALPASGCDQQFRSRAKAVPVILHSRGERDHTGTFGYAHLPHTRCCRRYRPIMLWDRDRPAALLAWIVALTCTHARSMPCEQGLARLGCAENATAAALKASSLRTSMTGLRTNLDIGVKHDGSSPPAPLWFVFALPCARTLRAQIPRIVDAQFAKFTLVS